MNKKAHIFSIGLVLISIVILISGLIVVSEKKAKFRDEKGNDLVIGERQFKLFNIYNQGEKVLLYVDLASKFAAKQSVYDLGKNSGFFYEQGCGEYMGVKVWKNSTDECFPDVYNSFIGFFEYNLDEQLRITPYNISLNNYDFVVGKTKITGIATRNIFLNKSNITYSIKPSFTTEMDYDLSIYDKLKTQSTELIWSCFDVDGFMGCINTKIQEYKQDGVEWEVVGCGNSSNIPNDKCTEERFVSFSVKTGDVFSVYDYDEGENKFRNITIGFALGFI
ncbi:hypothetical protein HQ529_05550 [Candidatus Woesearchaeota archaeon]|nr:hypothetical protein [Candidatus Woesearchaeota archaeon]